VVDMSKTKGIAVFIVFLVLIVLAVLFTQAPTIEPHEGNIAGLDIQFRDGITELEAKTILENYNMTIYKLDYNVYDLPYKYYIMVDNNKIMDVKDDLRKEEYWTESTPDIKKGNYYIITVPEQVIHDKNFLEILNKYNLQLKKSVWCHIRFGKHPLSGISVEHANELKSELEMNENIFLVGFESFIA
jgi:hypothetical protein